MKVTLHIPTEQFGFCELETTSEVSPEKAAETYSIFSKAFQPKPANALETKEFNAALDEYLETDSLINGVEIYNKMSPLQQQVFQEIKKSLKRIKSKEEKPNV